MRKRIAGALLKLAHRIHTPANPARATHEPSEATRRGGYTIADVEAMRADYDRMRGPYTSFRLNPEVIADQRSADIRAHAKRAIR